MGCRTPSVEHDIDVLDSEFAQQFSEDDKMQLDNNNQGRVPRPRKLEFPDPGSRSGFV